TGRPPAGEPDTGEPTGRSTRTEPRPGQSNTGRSRFRDPFFDNAKFLAIVLVVVGHALEPLRDIAAVHAVYLFLYMFHMPVFIVISGYLSRGFPSSGDKVQKLVSQLLVPFLVFQLAYILFARLDGKEPALNLLDPYYLTWFLLALFAWRVSTPLWQRLRWPLLVAVGICLVAGTQELVDEFEMGRVLSLLPFFVLGLRLKPEHFALLRKGWVRLLAVPTMLGGLVVAFWAHDRMSLDWVFWRSDNMTLQVDDATGTVMRLAMLVSATVLTTAFLALVPRRRYWFTALGTWTLYVYLLHGFAVKGATYAGLFDEPWIRTPLGHATVALAGVVLTLVLSSAPVRRLTRWAVEPPTDWVFRRPARSRRRTTG
ncbi:MAG TPA: acyltransferase family protein, partial [Actinopolymorphaceae bacterium]